MSNEELEHIYITTCRLKSEELRLIVAETFQKARDKSLVEDIELSVISLASCGYFQSLLTEKIYKMADINYRLGGNLKDLVGQLAALIKIYEQEKENYFALNPEKSHALVIRPKRLLGKIPIPFTRIGEMKGEQNPYTFSHPIAEAKSEREIIEEYAKMRSTIYFYKKSIMKNKVSGTIYKDFKERKLTNNKGKTLQIMTDILTDFQNQAPEVVLYLSNILARGVASGVGKDLWEKIKEKFPTEKDQIVIKEFESNPQSEKYQGKFEYLLENKLTELPHNDLLEIFTTFQKLKAEPEYRAVIKRSKNVVSGSTINAGGNIHIGDIRNDRR